MSANLLQIPGFRDSHCCFVPPWVEASAGPLQRRTADLSAQTEMAPGRFWSPNRAGHASEGVTVQLAILQLPAAEGPAGTNLLARVRGKFSRASRAKRCPRDADYLRGLAARHLDSSCRLVEVPEALDPQLLRSADEIVLLWPDGNGYGWSPVEWAVFRHKAPLAHVSVLNGRGRHFELTPRVLASYRLRRTLERFWVGELAFTVTFLAFSPLLVGWDLIKGRR